MELSRRSKCNLWCMTWSGTRYIVHLTMTLDNGSVCQIPSLVSVRPFAPHAHLGNISHSGSGPFSHLLASARTLTPYKPPLPVLQLLFSPHNSSSQFTSSRAVRRSFQSRSLLDNLELLASLLRGVALCACRSSLPYWGCSHFTGTPPALASPNLMSPTSVLLASLLGAWFLSSISPKATSAARPTAAQRQLAFMVRVAAAPATHVSSVAVATAMVRTLFACSLQSANCLCPGQCGYRNEHCSPSSPKTCVANCDAKAPCGEFSADGKTVCPLNACCSRLGFCGTSNVFCRDTPTSVGDSTCSGGSCGDIQSPSCRKGSGSASRRIAYYQSWYVPSLTASISEVPRAHNL
jgi:hypothetical protein